MVDIDDVVSGAQDAAKDAAEAVGLEEEADAVEDQIQKTTGVDLGGSGGGKNDPDVRKQGKEDPGINPDAGKEKDKQNKSSSSNIAGAKDPSINDANDGSDPSISGGTGGNKQSFEVTTVEEQQRQKTRQKTNENTVNQSNLTEEGREFVEARNQLKERPTFSLQKESVVSELGKKGIRDQFAASAQTFQENIRVTDVNTVDPLTGPKLAVEAIGSASRDFVGEQESPRQEFQDSLPALSVAQQRFTDTANELENKLTREQKDQVTEDTVEAFNRGFNAGLLNQDIPGETDDRIREIERQFVTGAPEAIAGEIPEKAIESASLAGAAAATAEDPGEVARQTAEGSAEIAGEISENPVGFTRDEIAADVGLDLATGAATGGAVITVPEVRSTVSSGASKARSGFQELRELREGGKEQSAGDVFTEAALNQDFANEAVVDTGPARSQENPFDIPGQQPERPSRTTSRETVSEPVSRESTTSEVGPTTTTKPLSEPVVSDFAEPQVNDIVESQPDSKVSTEPIAEPQPQVQAQPQSNVLPIVEPVAVPQTRAAPEVVAQPQAQPQSRTNIVPRFDIDEEEDFQNDEFLDEEIGETSESTEFAPSLAGKVLGIERQSSGEDPTFTGLEVRGFEERSSEEDVGLDENEFRF